MPPVKMNRTTKAVLFFLRIYLMVLVALLFVRFFIHR